MNHLLPKIVPPPFVLGLWSYSLLLGSPSPWDHLDRHVTTNLLCDTDFDRNICIMEAIL